jgi:microcin C transport system substrate-binding protein
MLNCRQHEMGQQEIGRTKPEMRMRLTPLTVAAMALLSFGFVADRARAEEPKCRHALSLVGEPKFGPDFKNFNWVNPDAP